MEQYKVHQQWVLQGEFQKVKSTNPILSILLVHDFYKIMNHAQPGVGKGFNPFHSSRPKRGVRFKFHRMRNPFKSWVLAQQQALSQLVLSTLNQIKLMTLNQIRLMTLKMARKQKIENLQAWLLMRKSKIQESIKLQVVQKVEFQLGNLCLYFIYTGLEKRDIPIQNCKERAGVQGMQHLSVFYT